VRNGTDLGLVGRIDHGLAVDALPGAGDIELKFGILGHRANTPFVFVVSGAPRGGAGGLTASAQRLIRVAVR
jgi:hypothetical protein